ncbi:MAG TPA: hypothetical protein VEQ10_21425 [Vicinamibacteria bacterium]|nr:hypothetical protein [Vicinamibacteria bacterium]
MARHRAKGTKAFFAASAVAVGLALAAACGGGGGSTPASSTPAGSNGNSNGTGATKADVLVTINGMVGSKGYYDQGGIAYTPTPAKVKVGQTVAWTNSDSVAHTATGAGFDTGAIAPGATSAPVVFNTPGTVNYSCTFHPSMTGSLTVQ